jgi:hypothetical protein
VSGPDRIGDALSCFPLRVEWDGGVQDANRVVPWPQPEVPARAVAPGDPVPVAARRLADRLMRITEGLAGARYSRGTSMVRGKPGSVVDAVAVRGRRPDGRAAVAVWIDGKLDGAWLRSVGGIPVRAQARRRTTVGANGRERAETLVEVVVRWLSDPEPVDTVST